MSKLSWNEIDKRFFESGVDQGVLYLDDTTGVSWNGLISIEPQGESPNELLYFDGNPYNTQNSRIAFKATLNAVTYPDEFIEYDGLTNLGSGLFVKDSKKKTFGLSYRTNIYSNQTNEIIGTRIHILYNLIAVPKDNIQETLSNAVNFKPFTWSISSKPEKVANFIPTGYVYLDSTELNPDVFQTIQNILYGTESTNPRLPSLAELYTLVIDFAPVIIVPNTVTGLAELITGVGDLTLTTDGIYSALPTTNLVETSIAGFFILSA